MTGRDQQDTDDLILTLQAMDRDLTMLSEALIQLADWITKMLPNTAWPRDFETVRRAVLRAREMQRAREVR